MKRLMIFGAVWVLAVAKPELYKEKEDFQFSRSSSDDGSKSGFYGAQRGNMGGNYERAHNMDSLAQNQMSGIVRQVEGELGDGARTRTGSVYSAANSRGTYGSGQFDLSNLAGRNFQESNSYGHSQAASTHNTAYNANSRSQSSRHNEYQATGYSGLNLQSDDLQALDHTQAAGQYDYGRQTSNTAGYNAQSGFQQHAAYDTSNANLHSGGYGSNVNTRLISATPVRVIVRPGTRVAIPVAAQSYDLTHGSALINQNSLNSDAELLSNDNQRTVYRPNNNKHYESSYNYRKEWEKHSSLPSPTTTDNPFPRNSELYEDRQAHVASDQYDSRRVDSQRALSSYGGYNAVKSTSGQSGLNYDNTNGYQSQYNAGSLTQAAHSANAAADLNSQVENINTKPKSYQSAYSYHKSWEHQGDPYVIKPASSGYYDGQSSQRLTSGLEQNLGYSATGSHYQHSHQSGVDCDENGHIRVARSYDADQHQEMQQQSHNLEDLSQQPQSQNLEDFGQQQQSQNLEDFGQQQQSQNLEDFGQQQQSQNLEDFGQQQQSQNLEDFGQQQQSQNLEDFGQQQQSQKLAEFGQQQYKQNLEDLHQQVDNLGQQTQVLWDPQEAGQQAQNTWDNLEQLSQQSQNQWDDRQHVWDKFEDLEQQPQDINKQLSNVEQNKQNNLGQHTQDNKTELKLNSQDHKVQDKWDFRNKSRDEQQNRNTHDQSNHFNQQETELQQNNDLFNILQQSQKHNNDQISVWDKFDFGSDHNVQQNKFNSEHTNTTSNGRLDSQQTGVDQLSLNSGSNPDQSQSVNNVNKSLNSDQISSTQQVHKISDTDTGNTGYINLHNDDFNLHTNQNQFFKDESAFLENHKLYEGSNWYLSNNHRQEQTTNTESYSHAFEAIPPITAPLSNLWNKLGNIEQTSLSGTRNVDQGHSFSQVHTSTQNSYSNSMHAYHNMENISQEHLDSQIKPYHDLILHINDTDTSQKKSNETKMEKESPLDIGRGDIGPEDLSDSNPNKYPSDTPVSSETIQNRDENNVTNNINTQHYNHAVEHHENAHGQNNLGQNENLPEQSSNFHQILQHHDFQEQKDVEEQQNLHVLSLHENIEHPNPQDSKKQHDVQVHDESPEQQNLQGFGQQENEDQTKLPNFGKQGKLDQQNLQDFGLQVNIEPQNINDFGKQDNLEQQSLQVGQQENLEQQNLQDFGQQVNVEQQNLQDFGQQVNVEQQNLQDFGQQVNLEQQNLQDFGQQVNVEQQNLQDFGQQENVEQQNLQDFGKQDNLEQQNLKDFEQPNSPNFGSPSNMQQINENVEQLSQNLEKKLKYSKEEQPTVSKNNVQSQTYLSPSEVTEQSIVKKQNNDLQSMSVQTPSTEISPIEAVTESTGFWKSIGNKFSSAKSKISSWF